MALIKCRCGKTEIYFKHLKKEDIPNGFEHECCAQEEPLKKVIEVDPSAEELIPAPKKKKAKKQE